MSYLELFIYIVIAFIVRRIFRYYISSAKDKYNNTKVEDLKSQIKINPIKKKQYQRQILNLRFGHIDSAMRFMFLDIGSFLVGVFIARMIFGDLAYWLLIYIVSMIILGMFVSRVVKRRFNIEWL